MNANLEEGTSSAEREALLDLALQAGLKRGSSNPMGISAVARDKPAPLSFAQQRMWFLAQLDESGTTYHVDDGVRLDGNLDRTAFKGALDALVARHGALRTRFSLVDGKPLQWLDMAEKGFALLEEDLRKVGDPDQALADAVLRNARKRFDLEKGPLVRGLLLRLTEQSHVFVMTLHHIVCDGWSMGVLIHDLTEMYEARVHAREADLPRLSIDYIDYAAWQRAALDSEGIQLQLAYWLRKLESAPALLLLPTDRRRTRQGDSEGSSLTISFDASTVQKARELSARRSMTLYMTMFAAWVIALVRLSSERDFVIATPVSNRTSLAMEPVVGFFTNTLAIRFDFRSCHANVTVAEMLALIREQLLEAQRHQDVPFEQVIKAVQPLRQAGHGPFLQLMFGWQAKPREVGRTPTLKAVSFETNHRTRDSEIAVSIGDLGDTVAGHIAYSSELYDVATIHSFVEAWQSVLKAIVEDESQQLNALPLMSDETRRRMLKDWNQAHLIAPKTGVEDMVHKRLEVHARTIGDATALVQGDKVVSYGELNALADQFAQRLVSLGIGPDALVAIVAEKSVAAVIAMLAVLKAGGAYMTVQVSWSTAALSRALQVSAPRMMLVDETGHKAIAGVEADVPLVHLHELDQGGPSATLRRHQWNPSGMPFAHPRNIAYAICTSGSTGSPKIVTVEHCNLSALIQWHEERFALKPGQRMSCFASLGFDASVWEIWSVLCAGAELLLPPLREVTQDELLDWWCTQKLDASFLPTPVAEYAFSRGIVHPSLKTLFVGGDRLRTVPAQWQLEALVDLYGTSEATVISIAGQVDLRRTRASLGRPTSNGIVYVLDAYSIPLPVGVPGEIFLGGRCVSRGYLHDPKQSAARFMPDPFSDEVGARMYKTGDMGRWLADGTIEFLGRQDHAVKVGGVRIELGEIEASLRENPLVREAVVVARAGEMDSTLVAYVIAEDAENKPEPSLLRAYLATRLPSYLVPRAFVSLDAWPLNANGKLDRAALPAPIATIVPPEGMYEIAVARHWCALLKLPAVSRDDDFFELGGHSLLCAQLNHNIFLECSVDVGIRQIYEIRTLKNIAERVEILSKERSHYLSPMHGSPSGTLEI